MGSADFIVLYHRREDLKLKYPIFTGAAVSFRLLHADDFRPILVMPCYPQG